MSKKIICYDLDRNKFKIESNKLMFCPSVYGVLIKDNKILLSKQWSGYDFPGGGIEIHETVDEALKREFFEETGVKVEILQPVYCGTSFFHPSHSEKYKGQYWNCPLIYYLVKKVGGKISKDNFDEEEKNYADLPEWINLEKIKELRFFNSVDSLAVVREAKNIYKKL